MTRIFISYASTDGDFVDKLADSLKRLQHTVWLDKWEIGVGDSVISRIEDGIANADFLGVILSKRSTASPWVEREWQAKYWDEISARRVMVLPIRLDDSPIPSLLRAKRYADFRTDYEVGLCGLASALCHKTNSGIVRCYRDFVEIVDEWRDLFGRSTTLDLLTMYSATWRNTYLSDICKLLSNTECKLRVFVPDVLANNHLLQLYSKRMRIDASELRKRITTAISDWSQLQVRGRVAIYSSATYLTHACYLFDSGGVVAHYSYRPHRIPTPAIVLDDGDFLRFLRADFEWLVSQENPSRRVLFESEG